METIKYEVRFECHYYDIDIGDDGNYVHVADFEEYDEAILFARRVDEQAHPVGIHEVEEPIEIENGFISGTASVFKITHKEESINHT